MFPFPSNPVDGQQVLHQTTDGMVLATYEAATNSWQLARGGQVPGPNPEAVPIRFEDLQNTPLVGGARDGQTIKYLEASQQWIATDVPQPLGPATQTFLGGIKVGTGLAITEDGTLSATGGGGGETVTITDNLSSTATDAALSANQGRVLNELSNNMLATVNPPVWAASPGIYAIGAVVSDNGKFWVATRTVVGTEAPGVSWKWDEMTLEAIQARTLPLVYESVASLDAGYYTLHLRNRDGKGVWEWDDSLAVMPYATITKAGLLGPADKVKLNAITGTVSIVVAKGTAALGTAAIASGANATTVTVAAAGVAITDVIDWGFQLNPNAVTGYNAALTTGCLVITCFPTAGNVNFVISNPTAASITPGALTLNWTVVR
jgi:hypothetical protein